MYTLYNVHSVHCTQCTLYEGYTYVYSVDIAIAIVAGIPAGVDTAIAISLYITI